MSTYMKSGAACREAHIDQHKMNAYIGNGDYPCAPAHGGSGTTRLYGTALDLPVLCIFGDLIKTYTVRQSGKIAARIKAAMEDYPDADQLTMVTLSNGATSVRPTATLDLSSGYVSGGYVCSAMMFDIRNYRDRVARAIAAAPTVIGGDDA